MQRFLFAALVLIGVVVQINANGVNYIPMFDFDGNLLSTDAKLYFEHYDAATGTWTAVNLTNNEWIAVHEDPTYRSSTTLDTYREFTDENGDDTFKLQVLDAIKNQSNFGPAYPFLKAHIIQGVPFSIITARAHDSLNLKSGIDALFGATMTKDEKWQATGNFIKQLGNHIGFYDTEKYYAQFFLDETNVWNTYFRGCNFVAVSNPWFVIRNGCQSSAACKALVVARYTAEGMLASLKGVGSSTVVSFYDDERPNIDAVMYHMKSFLAPSLPTVCFRVYDTSDLLHAKQIDINAACNNLPAGADWQSSLFRSLHKGSTRHQAF